MGYSYKVTRVRGTRVLDPLEKMSVKSDSASILRLEPWEVEEDPRSFDKVFSTFVVVVIGLREHFGQFTLFSKGPSCLRCWPQGDRDVLVIFFHVHASSSTWRMTDV